MRTKTWLRITTVGMSVAITVVGLSLFLREAHALSQNTCSSMIAIWKFKPQDLNESKVVAKQVVTARVTGIEPGKDLVVKAPGEPSGEERIPTQRIRLEILKSHKGDRTSELVLFKTGNDECYALDDPPFTLGEVTVLFLVERADEAGIYRLIAPEGRYKVENGKLVPMVHDGFAENWRGRTLDELERELGGSGGLN